MNDRLPQGVTIHTTDALGEPLDITLGIVHDLDGKSRLGLCVGESATAMLNYDDGTGPNILPLTRRKLAQLIREGTP